MDSEIRLSLIVLYLALALSIACNDLGGETSKDASMADAKTAIDSGHVPEVGPTSDAGPLPAPASCGVDDVVGELSGDASMVGCSAIAGDASAGDPTALVACVQGAIDARQAFLVFSSQAGTDSIYGDGFFGMPLDGRVQVYKIDYDSFGIAPFGWVTTWTPCTTFTVNEDCLTQGSECLVCVDAIAKACGCETTTSGVTVECLAPDVPPCVAGSCNFDGVCYPSGTGTEDGCCYCRDGQGSCDESSGCPGWAVLGKRCAADRDCAIRGTYSGYLCRTDFAGERGVCTRKCNYGCPTGTECVAQVPDNNGGFVVDMCLLTCTTSADCSMAGSSVDLGSECDAVGDLTQTYCF